MHERNREILADLGYGDDEQARLIAVHTELAKD
jgi:hypothetical protein